MPQFALYRYPGRNQDIAFVVQIQNTKLERGIGRVVLPLVRVGARSPSDHPLTPRFLVRGESVFANPLDIVTISIKRLGKVLAMLSDPDQDRIIRAIDEMISRA